MNQNELKTVDFYVRFYNGMGPQKIELPEDIELTLIYETEEGENKYIGIGKHIDDAEYNCHQLGVIQFGEYDLFIFDKSYLNDENVVLVDFDEFNKKWSEIFKKFYFQEMFIDFDTSYACGYKQEIIRIGKFIKFNNDSGDNFIKLACVGFKSYNANIIDDSMSIIDVNPYELMKFLSENIHCVIKRDETIVVKYNERIEYIKNKFENYKDEPNDEIFHQGQIITNGKCIGIFDKYLRGSDGKIDSFCYYDIETIREQSFVSGNDINDWNLGDKSTCFSVYNFMEENNLYYDPYIGKIEEHKNDD